MMLLPFVVLFSMNLHALQLLSLGPVHSSIPLLESASENNRFQARQREKESFPEVMQGCAALRYQAFLSTFSEWKGNLRTSVSKTKIPRVTVLSEATGYPRSQPEK